MAANYSITIRAVGEILTASKYNADNQLPVTNGTPAGLDDASVDNAAMQATTDPGEVGSESRATSLEGELQRLRFILAEITGRTQWYETPEMYLSPYNAQWMT